MVTIERPKSLTEEVTMRLRAEIVEGDFKLGEVLSESMIADRYSVSRTPVREAFACLGLEGLVRTEPQQGTFVFTITREQFHQLSETRSVLETAALRLAVERNGKALVRSWTRIVAAMEAAVKAGEGKRYNRLDGDFHRVIFDLARNPYLVEATQSFQTKFASIRNRLGANPEHMRHSLSEHVQLLRLLEDNRINSAVELLDHHIRFKGETFWAAAERMDEMAAMTGPAPGRLARRRASAAARSADERPRRTVGDKT